MITLPLDETYFTRANPAVLLNRMNELKCIVNHLGMVIDSSYEGIVVSDPNNIIIQVNDSVERITGGIKPESLLGKTAEELEKDGAIVSQTKTILRRNPLTIKQKLKTGVELLLTSNRVCDEHGKVLFFVTTIRDMSHLENLQKELEKAKDLSNKYFCKLQELRNTFTGLMDLDEIIIESPGMLEVMKKISKVARTEATVLLTGESGVGKEVVANMIHKLSYRKDAPFIKINCGAIPEALLESELFGYEKGAFTDASRGGKPGFFELANKGNILLDEIGDLPLSLQVKLLRVIQEKEVFRLGGVKPIKLDLRIIAATNRSLGEMVKKGMFREDLYYRLSVFPIEIPPLRMRKTDILPLANMFLKKYNEKHNLQKKLLPAMNNFLENYSWPGNIRELKNMIEHLVIISDQDNINLDHISASLLKISQALFKNPDTPFPVASGRSSPEDFLPAGLEKEGSGDDEFSSQAAWKNCNDILQQTFENIFQHNQSPVPALRHVRELVEQQFVAAALKKYKSQRKASKILGIDHTTLTRKLQKWRHLP